MGRRRLFHHLLDETALITLWAFVGTSLRDRSGGGLGVRACVRGIGRGIGRAYVRVWRTDGTRQ